MRPELSLASLRTTENMRDRQAGIQRLTHQLSQWLLPGNSLGRRMGLGWGERHIPLDSETSSLSGWP
jgi:hypothetical protein